MSTSSGQRKHGCECECKCCDNARTRRASGQRARKVMSGGELWKEGRAAGGRVQPKLHLQ